jgi:hypothetical protein
VAAAAFRMPAFATSDIKRQGPQENIINFDEFAQQSWNHPPVIVHAD